MIQIEAPVDKNMYKDNRMDNMWLLFFQGLSNLKGDIGYTTISKGVIINIGYMSFIRLDVDDSDSVSEYELPTDVHGNKGNYFKGYLDCVSDTDSMKVRVENNKIHLPTITTESVVSGFLIKRKEV